MGGGHGCNGRTAGRGEGVLQGTHECRDQHLVTSLEGGKGWQYTLHPPTCPCVCGAGGVVHCITMHAHTQVNVTYTGELTCTGQVTCTGHVTHTEGLHMQVR